MIILYNWWGHFSSKKTKRFVITKKWIFGGASSIARIDIFVANMKQHGINPILLETENLFSSIQNKYKKFVISGGSIPYTNSVFIPLNEYWVTKAYEASIQNISTNAFKASRSKIYLSKLLSDHKLDYVKRDYLDDIRTLPFCDFLVRIDSGFSGYGIATFNGSSKTNTTTIKNILLSKTSSNMENILGVVEHKYVIEKHLSGDEYSVDIFKFKQKTTILRVCIKSVQWILGAPCTVNYTTIPISDSLKNVINSWVDAIFNEKDISFAHFDFISQNGQFLPLDFSCRVGGGLQNLTRHSFTGCYISSPILNMLHNQKKMVLKPFVSQFNVISEVDGIFKVIYCSLDYPHYMYILQNIGDYLFGNRGSASRRIAEIIYKANSLDESLKIEYRILQSIQLEIEQDTNIER